jgi:hypothetical protein
MLDAPDAKLIDEYNNKISQKVAALAGTQEALNVTRNDPDLIASKGTVMEKLRIAGDVIRQWTGDQPFEKILKRLDGDERNFRYQQKKALDEGVITEEVYNQHQTKIPGYKQLVRDDTNELIAIHKDSYKVITHQQSYELAYDYLSNHFHTDDMTEQYRVSNKGALMAIHFRLPAYSVPYKGSFITLEAILHNSYNGMRQLTFDLGYYFMLCLNGLKSPLWDVRISSQHKGNKEVTFERPNTFDVNDRLRTVSNTMEKWSSIPVDNNELEYQVDQLCLQPTEQDKSHVNQRHRGYILDEYYDNYSRQFGKNKFSAYQAMTHWSTHYPSDSINTRYDRERKVANCKWFH